MIDDDDNAISREMLYDPTTLPAIVAMNVVLPNGARWMYGWLSGQNVREFPLANTSL
jgi:hypothetical protein